MREGTRFPALALGFLLLAAPLAGQQGAPAVAGTGWMLGWTPLAPVADLPRGVAGALPAGSGLLAPAPRFGIFWTGGNPAGLPWEAATSYGELGVRATAVEGEFRRPLDAPAAEARGSAGLGWQPVGEHAAMIGHAAFDEVHTNPGTHTLQLEPYASTPFVITDSTATPHQTARARLDGAAGWRRGALGFGVSVAYEAVDASTAATRVPRFGRASRPAAALGIGHELAGGAARLGAYARWNRTNATLRTLASPGVTLVTRINGFAAPTVAVVAPGVIPPWYHRRSEAEGRAAGVTAAGSARGWAWAAHTEVGVLAERSWTREEVDPPTDLWRARSAALGGALQRGLGGALLTLRGGGVGLAGEAHMAALDSVIYRATEAALHGAAELRWQPAGSAWQALAGAGVAYERRDRGDTIDNVLRTRLESLTRQVRGEVAYALTGDLSLAAGAALTDYVPRGSIPIPRNYPAAIRPLVGAETAFYSTRNLAHTGSVAALWRVRGAIALRLTGHYESREPSAGPVRHEMTPEGTRTQWGLSLAAVIQ